MKFSQNFWSINLIGIKNNELNSFQEKNMIIDINRVQILLEISEILEISGKLIFIREIRDKSGNLFEVSGKKYLFNL